MSHVLICGVTESGKTTLARAIASGLSKRGQNVIAYDPVGTPTANGDWPENAVVFSDEEEFFEYMSRDDVIGAHVFIDEAGDIFNLGKRHNFWLLTRGRHFGLHIYMIAQRPKMIAPTARTQAATGYMFRLSPDDAAEVAADFGHGKNILQKELDKGDFIALYSGTTRIKRANIFKLLESKP